MSPPLNSIIPHTLIYSTSSSSSSSSSSSCLPNQHQHQAINLITPWISDKRCIYPQILTIELHNCNVIEEISITAHENLTPSKIEMFLGVQEEPSYDRTDTDISDNVVYKRLGFMKFKPPNANHPQSQSQSQSQQKKRRETKTLEDLHQKCNLVKLVVHEPLLTKVRMSVNEAYQTSIVNVEVRGRDSFVDYSKRDDYEISDYQHLMIAEVIKKSSSSNDDVLTDYINENSNKFNDYEVALLQGGISTDVILNTILDNNPEAITMKLDNDKLKLINRINELRLTAVKSEKYDVAQRWKVLQKQAIELSLSLFKCKRDELVFANEDDFDSAEMKRVQVEVLVKEMNEMVVKYDIWKDHDDDGNDGDNMLDISKTSSSSSKKQKKENINCEEIIQKILLTDQNETDSTLSKSSVTDLLIASRKVIGRLAIAAATNMQDDLQDDLDLNLQNTISKLANHNLFGVSLIATACCNLPLDDNDNNDNISYEVLLSKLQCTQLMTKEYGCLPYTSISKSDTLNILKIGLQDVNSNARRLACRLITTLLERREFSMAELALEFKSWYLDRDAGDLIIVVFGDYEERIRVERDELVRELSLKQEREVEDRRLKIAQDIIDKKEGIRTDAIEIADRLAKESEKEEKKVRRKEKEKAKEKVKLAAELEAKEKLKLAEELMIKAQSMEELAKAKEREREAERAEDEVKNSISEEEVGEVEAFESDGVKDDDRDATDDVVEEEKVEEEVVLTPVESKTVEVKAEKPVPEPIIEVEKEKAIITEPLAKERPVIEIKEPVTDDIPDDTKKYDHIRPQSQSPQKPTNTIETPKSQSQQKPTNNNETPTGTETKPETKPEEVKPVPSEVRPEPTIPPPAIEELEVDEEVKATPPASPVPIPPVSEPIPTPPEAELEPEREPSPTPIPAPSPVKKEDEVVVAKKKGGCSIS